MPRSVRHIGTVRGRFSLVARSLRSLRVLRLRRASIYGRAGTYRHSKSTRRTPDVAAFP
jgi:hypothetical protein